MGTDLVVVIASRGRPETVERTAVAFAETGADEVPIVYAVEADDPTLPAYEAAVARWLAYGSIETGLFGGFVAAVDETSRRVLADLDPFAITMLNDDHFPRTPGWHTTIVDALRNFHPALGMVYVEDGYQHNNLPDSWTVTGSWVRTLGRMVPARLGHLYADNAILDLATDVGCATYLPAVEIIHEHPVAGFGEWTDGHKRVNSKAQYAADRAVYRAWVKSRRRRDQADALREVIRNG